MQPFPVAVLFDGADELHPSGQELSVCGAELVDLKQRRGAAGMLAEEVEIRVARREDLHAIAAGQRQLRGRGLLELDPKSHDVAQQLEHRFVRVCRNAKPAQSQDSHRLSIDLRHPRNDATLSDQP
jgi:hypothetical protein